MKKILSALLLLVMVGCTPVRYVMVDPKDSTKLVEVRKRIIYDDFYLDPMPSFRYNNWWLYNPPIYSPRIIIQKRQPIVVQPQRPVRPQPNWHRPVMPPRTPRNK